MGASWNRTLWTAVGTAVSDEVRGLYSQVRASSAILRSTGQPNSSAFITGAMHERISSGSEEVTVVLYVKATIKSCPFEKTIRWF